RQTCLVCTRLENAGAFFLDRRQPEDRDSGWIFGCDSDHDHESAASWQRASLYSAVVDTSARALPYLAFPPGALVAVDAQGSPTFYLNDEQLSVRKNSYVAQWLERAKQKT